MQAEMNDVLELLSGSQQFEIPLYQRPYSWQDKDRAQLWSDVVAAGKDLGRKKHFIGSIVYTQPAMRMGGGGIRRARLIDGQQRLTTLTLLISALVEQLQEKGDLELPTGHGDDTEKVRASKWREKYLLNEDLSGDSQYKLLPTHADRATFKHLLGGAPTPERLSPQIIAGRDFFRDQFKVGTATLAEVITGLRKLEVVAVMLQEGKDDPQLIFESLNSTGKALTPADLIRNNVLMGLDPEQQDALSRDYWLPTEALFQDSPAGSFDRFMRDFLTVRSGSLVDEKKVYEAFKLYREKGGQNVLDLVADIYRMARHYATYLHPEREADPDLRLVLTDLQGIRVRVISPLALVMLADRDSGVVTTPDLVRALRAVESMLVRRAVADFRSNPLNKLFATAGQQLNRESSAGYLRSVELVLMAFQDRNKGGFPDDATFKEQLQTTDLYSLDVCKHILMRLERDLSPKEKLVMDNLTVEHVLPQNPDLSKAWREMLGADWQAVQEELKDTLGNLTLTGYNSELGDKPFEEKKSLPQQKGYATTRLLMTQRIAKEAVWNAETIRKRAEELSERALKLWPLPAVSAQELQALRGRRSKATRARAPRLPQSSEMFATHTALEIIDELTKRIVSVSPAIRYETEGGIRDFIVERPFCTLTPLRSWAKLTLAIPTHKLQVPDRFKAGWSASLGGEPNYEIPVDPKDLGSGALDSLEIVVHQALAFCHPNRPELQPNLVGLGLNYVDSEEEEDEEGSDYEE